MPLIRFSPDLDPVDGLLSLQRELGRVLESPFGSELGPSGRGVYPPMNAFSDREDYVLRMEVPGIAPENLKIETSRQDTDRVWKARDQDPRKRQLPSS